MAAYTPEELERMLTDLESDLAERKESLQGDAPTKAREAVCAFANDLPDHRRPGVLFIGARDDGSPSGLHVTDELIRQLADLKTDGNIVPPPTLTVAKHTLRGSEMAVVTILPSDSPPVRYKGRAYIRIGSRRGIASAQESITRSRSRRPSRSTSRCSCWSARGKNSTRPGDSVWATGTGRSSRRTAAGSGSSGAVVHRPAPVALLSSSAFHPACVWTRTAS